MPINSAMTFNADNKTVDPKTGQYNDPLMRWPLRGAAFTNEVGEALRPLIGDYATLSWAPALLYIGADIYDKYKNDQTEYSPDSKRCLKQACFQGLASILLPIIAVKGGQDIFSLSGLYSKDKITINTQEHILKLAKQFVANGKMRAYRNKDSECIKDFLDIVDNNIDYRDSRLSATDSWYTKLFKKFKINKKESINNYAKNIISMMILTRKQLLNPTSSYKQTELYSIYETALKSGETKNVAVKSVLTKSLNKKAIKGRLIKTLGGFTALGIAINPIDRFVENVLIGKVIGPGLDKTKNPTS